MATVEKISIALPTEMTIMLKTAVNNGEYSSTSEIIREALRAWKLRKKFESMELEELRNMVHEGIESGPGVDANLVFADLHKKYKHLLTAGEIL